MPTRLGLNSLVRQNQTPSSPGSDTAQARAIEAVSALDLTLKNFPKYNADKEVVMAAVKKTSQNIEFASDALKRDRAFLLDCIRAVPDQWYVIISLANVDYHIGHLDSQKFPVITDPEFLRSIIEINPNVYLCAHPELKAYSDIMLDAMDVALNLQVISKDARLKSLPPNSLPSGPLEVPLSHCESVSFEVNPSMQPEDILMQIATQLNNSIDTYKTSPLSPEQIQIKEVQGQFYIFIHSKRSVLRQLLPLLSEGPLKLEFGKVLKDNPLLGA